MGVPLVAGICIFRGKRYLELYSYRNYEEEAI